MELSLLSICAELSKHTYFDGGKRRNKKHGFSVKSLGTASS